MLRGRCVGRRVERGSPGDCLLLRAAAAGRAAAGAGSGLWRCRSTAGLGRKGGDLADERPALVIGVVDGFVGVGHGAEELDQGSVGFGDVFVEGHGGL